MTHFTAGTEVTATATAQGLTRGRVYTVVANHHTTPETTMNNAARTTITHSITHCRAARIDTAVATANGLRVERLSDGAHRGQWLAYDALNAPTLVRASQAEALAAAREFISTRYCGEERALRLGARLGAAAND